jgi:steroid 5-alpha reductase family enzyme
MLRLGGYLWFTRILPNHVDKRYVDLSEGWQMKKSIGFLWNFLLQGFLAWVLAMPFLFINNAPQLKSLFIVAIILILVGIVFETIADQQLQNFKRNHKGQVCNVGLWHYSRHPNYFFEWLVWLGFALMAISMQPFGLIGLVSPALLLFIMLVLTAPITEKGSLQSRGDAFKRYQQTTAYFVPWFKKQ